MGTLSVRENLEFSAALRLPGHMTRAQRRERVERVIETLGLYRCADTKVRMYMYVCKIVEIQWNISTPDTSDIVWMYV